MTDQTDDPFDLLLDDEWDVEAGDDGDVRDPETARFAVMWGAVFPGQLRASVLAILIGIAIQDRLIADIDQPLAKLLPKHRGAMSSDTAKVTLRHLMTMSV
jgi:hypothetical protein